MQKKLFIINLIITLVFLVFNFLLYLFDLKFRSWFYAFIIAILILLFIIYGLLFYFKRNELSSSHIKYISVIFVLMVTICSPVYILIINRFMPNETLVEIDDKLYVAVLNIDEYVDVGFYDNYGFVLMGTKERVHGYYGNGKFNPFKEEDKVSSVTYTYYDDVGFSIKEKFVSLYKDNSGNVINTYVVEKNFNDDKKYNINDEFLMPEDEVVLYEKKFDDVVIRFTKIDNVLGRKNLVRVLRSNNGGSDFLPVGTSVIKVGNSAKFKFIDENVGFINSSGVYYLNNSMDSFFVTIDGGKSFVSSKFNYSNDNVDFINIDEFPVIYEDYWKIKCSTYEIVDNEYENIDLFFVSYDSGKTWSLDE